MIVHGLKHSLQRSLDAFCKEVMNKDFNIREVTKGAFSQARAKVRPEAFIEMNDTVVRTFYDEAPYLVWKGKRLLSVDGTRLVLPNHKSVKEEFGVHHFGPKADSPKSLALASLLYDPLNLITLDARIAPYDSSEKELLLQHLDKVIPGDLLLLDRGYPSIAIFYLLYCKGVDFCVRMKENSWLEVRKFTEGDDKEKLVKFKLPAKDRELLAEYPDIIEDEITCRLVKITLPNGDLEILCTSLLDEEEYRYEDFAELYHYRWNEEEAYKLFKSRIEVEDFSGKTALAVKQDFFAKIFMMTMCSVLAFPIEERVRKEYTTEKNKFNQKINRTTAMDMTSRITISLLLKRIVSQAIEAFDEIVSKTREIIRPGRSVERKKRPKRQYHMNYKRL